MKKRNLPKILFVLTALAALPVVASEEDGPVLVVHITNVLRAEGEMRVGVFDNAEGFPDVTPLKQSVTLPVTSTGEMKVEIKGLKPGKYAVVVIHDLNLNGILDKHFFGLPKEPFAFSNDPVIPKGAPPFEECTFEFGEESLTIEMELPKK